MNETVKTAGFLVAAVLALAAGVWSHWSPPPAGTTTQQVVGSLLFPDLKPESAKALEIIEYDPDTATLKPFKVAEEKGLWRVPSHDNYPADASQQLGEAAAALGGCEIINIESEDPTTHVTYGVIDPDPKSLAGGTTGVGKRVTMEDSSGKKLAQLIIGKGIKDKPDLHFVRKPDQDPVYVVKLKTEKFSTKFEDWIEKDLLKLNSWDIEQVAFNDYSVDALEGTLDPRSKIQLAFDGKESKWKLDDLEVYDREKREYEPQELANDEELNSAKLNDLKNALDELKIVDVRRKPEGLAADLRAGEELANNRQIAMALMQRGFYLAETREGEKGIFSNEGEIRCGTKEGVEYVLRFGSIAGGSESETKADDESESADNDEQKADEKKDAGANRFIMVTAQFNEDLIAKPELAPLPGESPAKQEETGGKEEPAEGKEPPADDAEKASAVESNLSDAVGQLAQADGAPADDASASEDAAGESKDEGKAGAKPDEPATEAQSAEPAKKQTKSKDAKSDAKPEIPKPKTPEQQALDRVVKENEAKQKEYDGKVKKGREKVKELSDRFADWYYIVSDSTYQKIHLGRDDIIKKKTPPADAKKTDDEHDHDDEKNLLKQEDKTLSD